MKRAVCLLSGGLDSSTCIAIAKEDGYELYALSFDYGQLHRRELEAAKAIAKHYCVKEHVIYRLENFGGSALVDENMEIPLDRGEEEMTEIPASYVPARNTVFLSIALGWAEVLDADAIFIGVNALDYSGYPDCRPEFIEAYEAMANLATRTGVEGEGRLRIHTPLIDLSKAEIIARGLDLGVDYGLTSSCYDPNPEGVPCGGCDSCLLRAKGFAGAGVEDPLLSRVEDPLPADSMMREGG